MAFAVFTFVILIAYIIAGNLKVKKLEMKQKELLWRVESLENSISQS